MTRCSISSLQVSCLSLFLACACSSSGSDTEDTTTETASETGVLEISGTWAAPTVNEALVPVAVFKCPFEMPPVKFQKGTYKDGKALTTIAGLTPGEWCFLAYIDLNPEDGFKSVEGLDAIAYPPQGEKSFQVNIEAGRTTTVELTFEVHTVTEP